MIYAVLETESILAKAQTHRIQVECSVRGDRHWMRSTSAHSGREGDIGGTKNDFESVDVQPTFCRGYLVDHSNIYFEGVEEAYPRRLEEFCIASFVLALVVQHSDKHQKTSQSVNLSIASKLRNTASLQHIP